MLIEKLVIRTLKQIGIPDAITVILSDRNGVEPKSPYLIVNIISETKIGLPRKSLSHEDGSEVEKVFQVKDFSVGLTLHAEGNSEYHDWFQSFDTGLMSDYYEYAFYQNGLSLVDSTPLTYQPQPVDRTAYKRANLDLTLRSEILDEFKVDGIERVITVGNLVDSQNFNADNLVVETYLED